MIDQQNESVGTLSQEAMGDELQTQALIRVLEHYKEIVDNLQHHLEQQHKLQSDAVQALNKLKHYSEV